MRSLSPRNTRQRLLCSMWLRPRATTPWGTAAVLAMALSNPTAGPLKPNYVRAAANNWPSTETSVRNGQPAFEIIEAAKELPADLIIMSTHGRTGLKHLFLGASPNTSFGRLPARRWSSGIGSMNLSDLTCGSLKYR